MVNLYIFRRDLRVIDNKGLHQSLKTGKTIPIFIFSKKQIENNDYFSDNSFGFLIESLENLEKEIKGKNGKLNYFFDDDIKVIRNIHKNNKINNIYCNKDFTPYAKKRENKIKEFCEENKIGFYLIEDYTLLPLGTIMTQEKTAYKIYTPFFNKSKKFWKDIPKVKKLSKYPFLNTSLSNLKLSKMKKYYKENKNRLVYGGRDNGLKLLKEIKNQNDYSKKRNDLTYDTTHLSAYIKFGCISIREVFWKFKKHLKNDNTLFSQLFWREFYTYIVNYYPDVLGGQIGKNNKDFQDKFGKIKWENKKEYLEKWKKGETGFPIVDAGIKELLKTGYMHNRSRLISSSFLIKLCLIDWREGEKYFAQKLTDYDPAQNNGGWQFHHGGASNADYFRILSPISQGKRFDKKTEYIKRWLPQLKDIPSKDLIDWENNYKKYNLKEINYVKPMFEYKVRRELVLKKYKKSFNN